MYSGLTFAVDDYPTIILGSVLCDLLACELHGLLVIAIAIHCGEAYASKLCSEKYSSSNALSLCCIVPRYLCYDGTDVVALQEKKRWRRETVSGLH
jgi:hypothetical protein